jgi:hypothetical protein
MPNLVRHIFPLIVQTTLDVIQIVFRQNVNINMGVVFTSVIRLARYVTA